MQTHRLVRLIETIIKARTQPRQTHQQYLESLDIGQVQFYRDRLEIGRLGFLFPYSKREQGFVLKGEPIYNINGLPLGQIMALILAVRHHVMTVRGDFSLAYATYEALCTIVSALPSKTRNELGNMLDRIIVQDGFGCKKGILDKLQDALRSGNRILVDYQKENDKHPRRYTADPQRLYFGEDALLLDAVCADSGRSETFRVPLIKQIITTPFLTARQ